MKRELTLTRLMAWLYATIGGLTIFSGFLLTVEWMIAIEGSIEFSALFIAGGWIMGTGFGLVVIACVLSALDEIVCLLKRCRRELKIANVLNEPVQEKPASKVFKKV